MSNSISLICSFEKCGLYFEHPVTLPCGITVCNEHLDKYVTGKMFNCEICDEEHLMPKNGFQVNKVLENFLEKGFHLDQERKNAKDSFDKLSKLIEEYKSIKSDNLIYDFFSDIRNKVDLHREELIKEINDRSEEIIRQLKEKEEEITESAHELDKINDDIMNIWKIQLRNPESDLYDFENLSACIDSNFDFFEALIFEYKKDLFKNKLLEFVPRNDIKFGKLIETDSSTLTLSENFGKCIQTFECDDGFNIVEEIKGSDMFISSSGDDIKVWNAKKSKLVTLLEGHTRYVTCLSVTNDKIISGSNDKTIRIWDLETFECIEKIYCDSAVSCLLLISENRLISGNCDCSINLWDLNEFELLEKITEAHEAQVNQIILTHDLSKFISCSNDSKIKIWDSNSLACKTTLWSHQSIVFGLELMQDDKLLSCSRDKTVKIWNIKAGACMETIKFENSVISIKLLTPYLLAVGFNSKLVIYDLNKKKQTKKIDLADLRVINLFQNRNLLTSSKSIFSNEIKMYKL